LAEMPETKKLSENLVRQYKPHQKGLHEPSMLARLKMGYMLMSEDN